MTEIDWIDAGFRPPVRGITTTRAGGVSRAVHASLNLGESGGDDPAAVAENRRRLEACLPAAPRWLKQVHGSRVICLDDWQPGIEADGAWTRRPGTVAAVLTADCLPVLLADRSGGLVAAVHAGWRGLQRGVLSAALRDIPVVPGQLEAWIGPAIGHDAYEVGPEVRAAFADAYPAGARFFHPGAGDRLHADLKGLACDMLADLGVAEIRDVNLCTAADPDRFFSFRRDGPTGHMATLVWLEDD